MSEEKIISGVILVICFIALVVFIIVACIIDNNKNKAELTGFETYVVQKYDTFWAIYEERYIDKVSYEKALHDFKEDNNMKKYDLQEGQKVWLRIYK